MGRKRGSIFFIIVLTTVLCLSGCSAKEQKEQNGVCRNLITAVSFVQKMERTDENVAEKNVGIFRVYSKSVGITGHTGPRNRLAKSGTGNGGKKRDKHL